MSASKAKFEIDPESLKAARKRLRTIGTRVGSLMPELMEDVATFWHHRIMPEHFTPDAETRYGYEPRTPGYLKGSKRRYGVGQGKFVANILTGRTVRMMSQFYSIKATSKGATVRMDSPDYFRKPFIGTVRKDDGRVITITHQPDKVAEVTRVNARDFGRIREYAGGRLTQLVAALLGDKVAAKASA